MERISFRKHACTNLEILRGTSGGTGSEAGRRVTVLASLTRSVSHDLRVDGASYAVVKLVVELGQSVGCKQISINS